MTLAILHLAVLVLDGRRRSSGLDDTSCLLLPDLDDFVPRTRNAWARRFGRSFRASGRKGAAPCAGS